MSEYHKIQTMFMRDIASKHRTLILGQWSLPEFEYLAGNEWTFTEKVDGTNVRVSYDGLGGLQFGGRTDAAQMPTQLLTRLQDRFMSAAGQARLADTFQSTDTVVLYGEGYGAKIQKGGGNYRQDQDFVLFDVRVDKWWLQRADVEDVAKRLGLDVVPVIGKGTLHDAIALARAGIVSAWGPFPAEGIVARPTVELMSRSGHRIITKIKTRDFS